MLTVFLSKNAHDLQMSAFLELYNRQTESPDANYNKTVIFAHRVTRLLDSIAQNKDFFYGPVQMVGLISSHKTLYQDPDVGQVVSCLTHALIYGLMSNHSAEHPDGILSNSVLKSLYGVSGVNGTFLYRPGTERIPDNWYRRPIGDPYGATHVVVDLVEMGRYDPRVLVFGGNIHGPNTFAPIDLSSFTNGVYSAEVLLQGNNAACFAFQATRILFPAALVGVEQIALTLLQQVLGVVDEFLAVLTCPRLEGVNVSMLERYPGYRKSSRPV